MTKNVLITREIPDIGAKILEDHGYVVDVNKGVENLSQEEIIELLKKKPYDAVITILTDKIDNNIFTAAPSVKIFSNCATGYDNINIAEATEYGVTIANAPTDLSSIAVSEHAISMMMALADRIVEADKFVKAGKYAGWTPMSFLGVNTVDKVVGIVGVGRIGDGVARFANGLGMKVVYTDIVQNKKIEDEYGAVFYKTLEEILPISDFVTLHVPLLPSTQHLMNAKTLAMMKSTAFLINTSRGPVVEEAALIQALKDKVIAGAGLDVFEFEPKISPELFEMPNTILTPHIASANLDAREAMAKTAAENIIDFFEGKELKNKITK